MRRVAQRGCLFMDVRRVYDALGDSRIQIRAGSHTWARYSETTLSSSPPAPGRILDEESGRGQYGPKTFDSELNYYLLRIRSMAWSRS